MIWNYAKIQLNFTAFFSGTAIYLETATPHPLSTKLSPPWLGSIANNVQQPKYYYHAKLGAFTPKCTIFSLYGLIIMSFQLIAGSAQFLSGIQLTSCLRQKLNYLKKTFRTAVSDNMRPALSKTFQDFGFFFDVNQTVTIAINPWLSKAATTSRSYKIKYWRERTHSFSPSHHLQRSLTARVHWELKVYLRSMMKEDRSGGHALRHIHKDDDWIQPSHYRDGSVVFEEDRVHFCQETSIY